MGSQNIYEYKKINQLDRTLGLADQRLEPIRDKVDEIIIEYNHMAKDLELYKKAYKLLANRIKALEDERRPD